MSSTPNPSPSSVRFGKKLKIAVIAVFAIIFAWAVIAAVSNNSDDNSAPAPDAVDLSATSETAGEPTIEEPVASDFPTVEAPAYDPPGELPGLSLGEATEIELSEGKASVTVHSAEWATEGPVEGSERPQFGHYLVLDVEVEMLEGTDAVTASYFQARDLDNFSYDATTYPGFSPALEVADIEAGTSTRGLISFDMPQSDTVITLLDPFNAVARWAIDATGASQSAVPISVPSPNPAAVGETTEIEFYEGIGTATIHAMRWETTGPGEFSDAPENGNFLVLDVETMVNGGTGTAGPMYWSVIDANGNEYQSDVFAQFLPTLHDAELPAGQAARGLVAFDVAEGPVTVVLNNESGKAAEWEIG